MSENMIATIMTLVASIFGVWAIFKYIILIEVRIDSNTYKTLYDYFRDSSKFIVNEEFTSDIRHPIAFHALIIHKILPTFYISHGERLMQAGWHGKDFVSMITCLRWQYPVLRKFLSTGLKEASFKTHGVPVQLILPYGVDRIGSLNIKMSKPVLDLHVWEELDKEVEELANGSRMKTGALLYGLPGNGKTSLVKYLSTKYRLPIMIFTLNPEWSNHDLLLMFSNIPKRCIVLMEDFDNYFNKRDCIIGSSEKSPVKFTFDVILNGLDGVYNSYEQVVFIMTANDIEKIDDALKDRPSRFKFVRHIKNPNETIRRQLLPSEWVDCTDGLNLDQIFRLKEYCDAGYNFESAMKKMDKKFDYVQISKVAQQIYLERIKNNLDGDANADWQQAVQLIKSK